MEQIFYKIPLYTMATVGSLGLLYLSTFVIERAINKVLAIKNFGKVLIEWNRYGGKCKECKQDVYTPTIKRKRMVKESQKRVEQGDFVYCQAHGGALDFWGIYSQSLGKVICLDGAGDKCIEGKEIYVGGRYVHWTITKIIKCDDAIIEISERAKE